MIGCDYKFWSDFSVEHKAKILSLVKIKSDSRQIFVSSPVLDFTYLLLHLNYLFV